MRAERGFTLLEVMIALAVFALLSSAVLSACQFVLDQSGGLRERLFASWLADNQLTELRLRPPGIGRQRMARSFAGESWVIEQTVEGDRDGPMLNVELHVLRGTGAAAVYRTSGWIARPPEPVQP
ncbi:type II secretion system protein GspI [Pseudomonas sp. Bc-h]|jgi:general secretion pathway protein I|uniref:type II secretion system minor pseudopilin GspI n=1 Tax=Pseudomonas sp. Bc-h TaxID=1943632 RepID=UPI0009DA43C3|nr:type II secretion system minor pseudopilin GspI [Pseudomonas sp. Bc-h]OQR37663.1 type II secretion system protein GspI [Pseudomonas sp. Bc-h]